MRKTMTPPSVPYVLSYEPKCETYSPNRNDTTIHSSTASTPPGLTQRQPPWCALGEARYSTANITDTRMMSIGHLAAPQIVTAVSPSPIERPTAVAMSPLTTTMNALTMSSTPTSRVIP